MAAVFQCPHCEKSYPNNPALIGRKVRCSACKGIFQLQGDGVAIKVEVATKKAEQAEDGTGTAVAKNQLTRQLKGRSKRIDKKSLTARIQNSRSALKDAAEAALSEVKEEQGHREQAEKKDKSSRLDAAKAVEIYRSKQGSGNALLHYFWPSVALLLLCAFIVAFMLSEPSPVQKALNDFSKRVGKELAAHPLRMNEYRKRMWIYSRDGLEKPAIILNADTAHSVQQADIDWRRLCDVCKQKLGGMSVLPFFAIMVSSDKQAKVEKLWGDYVEKFYIGGFYKLLDREGIRFIHCKDVPELLRDSGLSDRDIYIISLLLVGTLDEDGAPCQDFGLLSNILVDAAAVFEIQGTGGMELVEKADDYEVIGSATFCGIVLGFQGIPGRADEWRVLELRHGASINEFYGDRYNPFVTLTDRAMKHITTHFGSKEAPPPGLESEGQE